MSRVPGEASEARRLSYEKLVRAKVPKAITLQLAEARRDLRSDEVVDASHAAGKYPALCHALHEAGPGLRFIELVDALAGSWLTSSTKLIEPSKAKRAGGTLQQLVHLSCAAWIGGGENEAAIAALAGASPNAFVRLGANTTNASNLRAALEHVLKVERFAFTFRHKLWRVAIQARMDILKRQVAFLELLMRVRRSLHRPGCLTVQGELARGGWLMQAELGELAEAEADENERRQHGESEEVERRMQGGGRRGEAWPDDVMAKVAEGRAVLQEMKLLTDAEIKAYLEGPGKGLEMVDGTSLGECSLPLHRPTEFFGTPVAGIPGMREDVVAVPYGSTQADFAEGGPIQRAGEALHATLRGAPKEYGGVERGYSKSGRERQRVQVSSRGRGGPTEPNDTMVLYAREAAAAVGPHCPPLADFLYRCNLSSPTGEQVEVQAQSSDSQAPGLHVDSCLGGRIRTITELEGPSGCVIARGARVGDTADDVLPEPRGRFVGVGLARRPGPGGTTMSLTPFFEGAQTVSHGTEIPEGPRCGLMSTLRWGDRGSDPVRAFAFRGMIYVTRESFDVWMAAALPG